MGDAGRTVTRQIAAGSVPATGRAVVPADPRRDRAGPGIAGRARLETGTEFGHDRVTSGRQAWCRPDIGNEVFA
jgi:hypothetical protein